jgi:N-acetyl-gamma-glutamyl-phosphate reductase
VTSRQLAGRSVADAFPRFAHHPTAQALDFSEHDAKKLAAAAEIIFLALPHGVSAETARPLLAEGARVIDLSADFRIRDAATYQEFYGAAHSVPDLLELAVYGLPEAYRDRIRAAKLVACPGCYPTSIILPMLPLLREKAIDSKRILVSSMSGVTGAGRKVEADYLFAEINESLRPYGVPKHRHLSEIEQEFSSAAGEKIVVQFAPHLVPVSRGILSTIFVDLANPKSDIASIYQRAYGREPFVRLLGSERLPDTRNVVSTNFIDIGWKFDARTARLVIMSALDNLTKGTSGQAVQCFNLMCGYDETAGLL